MYIQNTDQKFDLNFITNKVKSSPIRHFEAPEYSVYEKL